MEKSPLQELSRWIRNCLFCKISAKQISRESSSMKMTTCFAFEDINPQAPTHILICPRETFRRVSRDAEARWTRALLGKLQMLARQPGQGVPFCYPVTAIVINNGMRCRPVCIPSAPASPRRPQFSLASRLACSGRSSDRPERTAGAITRSRCSNSCVITIFAVWQGAPNDPASRPFAD